MVIFFPDYYTRAMKRIDPRIDEAIQRIAEVTGLTERQAGEIVLKSLEGYDLSSRFEQLQNLSDDSKRIGNGDVILFTNRPS